MDLTPGPFLKNTTLKKIVLHLFVLEDVVAFDLGCLTASVRTCSASGSFSISFVGYVYEGVGSSTFSDLR